MRYAVTMLVVVLLGVLVSLDPQLLRTAEGTLPGERTAQEEDALDPSLADAADSASSAEAGPVLPASVVLSPDRFDLRLPDAVLKATIELPAGWRATMLPVEHIRLCLSGDVCDPTAPGIERVLGSTDADGDGLPELEVSFGYGAVASLVRQAPFPALVEFTVSGRIGAARFAGRDSIEVTDRDGAVQTGEPGSGVAGGTLPGGPDGSAMTGDAASGTVSGLASGTALGEGERVGANAPSRGAPLSVSSAAPGREPREVTASAESAPAPGSAATAVASPPNPDAAPGTVESVPPPPVDETQSPPPPEPTRTPSPPAPDPDTPTPQPPVADRPAPPPPPPTHTPPPAPGPGEPRTPTPPPKPESPPAAEPNPTQSPPPEPAVTEEPKPEAKPKPPGAEKPDKEPNPNKPDKPPRPDKPDKPGNGPKNDE